MACPDNSTINIVPGIIIIIIMLMQKITAIKYFNKLVQFYHRLLSSLTLCSEYCIHGPGLPANLQS